MHSKAFAEELLCTGLDGDFGGRVSSDAFEVPLDSHPLGAGAVAHTGAGRVDPVGPGQDEEVPGSGDYADLCGVVGVILDVDVPVAGVGSYVDVVGVSGSASVESEDPASVVEDVVPVLSLEVVAGGSFEFPVAEDPMGVANHQEETVTSVVGGEGRPAVAEGFGEGSAELDGGLDLTGTGGAGGDGHGLTEPVKLVGEDGQMLTQSVDQFALSQSVTSLDVDLTGEFDQLRTFQLVQVEEFHVRSPDGAVVSATCQNNT